MHQQFRTNVPEQDSLHPLSVQLKGDQWHVFDGSTGGWSSQGIDFAHESRINPVGPDEAYDLFINRYLEIA